MGRGSWKTSKIGRGKVSKTFDEEVKARHQILKITWREKEKDWGR